MISRGYASVTCALLGLGLSGACTSEEVDTGGALRCEEALPPTPRCIPQVAAGGTHTLLLQEDRTVWALGEDDYGQLGLGPLHGSASAPQRVEPLQDVVAIAAGPLHSLALQADGTVWAWGSNAGGQLGPTAVAPQGRPVPIFTSQGDPVRAIATYYSASYAVTASGAVYAWGTVGPRFLAEPTRIPGLTQVQAVAGDLALRRDGTVWRFTAQGVAPEPVYLYDTQRGAQVLTGVRAIAAGGLHRLALRCDGTVWSWGDNQEGQLGEPSGGERQHAAPVSGLTQVAAIAAGALHSLALRWDGSVWTWGANQDGQLGHGAAGPAEHAPRPLTGMPLLAGLAAKVSPVNSYSLVLGRAGELWAFGKLPLGGAAPRPVELPRQPGACD